MTEPYTEPVLTMLLGAAEEERQAALEDVRHAEYELAKVNAWIAFLEMQKLELGLGE